MNNDPLSRITIDPEIAHGKPVIRGLRYPVQNILELLSAGMTFEEILEDYPDLEREDLLAAFAHVAKLTGENDINHAEDFRQAWADAMEGRVVTWEELLKALKNDD